MSNVREALEVQTSLLSLPDELLNLPENPEVSTSITSIVPKADLIKVLKPLAGSCKHLYKLFQPALYKEKLMKLASYIEEGNQDKVEAMVKDDLELLFVPLSVVNKETDQTIEKYTLVQLAYCEGDDEMCMMLKGYFELSCGSAQAAREAICKQLKEKFGEESQEEIERNASLVKAELCKLLNPVIQAITNEGFNNGVDANKKLILSNITLDAIETFRREFANIQPKVIRSGRRFRLETLRDLCELFSNTSNQWGPDINKIALLEDAVIAFVLRYVSKNDAQKFNQTLFNLLDKKEMFKRLSTTDNESNFYQAINSSSSIFSLPGCCIDIVFPRSATRFIGPNQIRFSYLEKLCDIKNSKFLNLYSPPTSENALVMRNT